MHAIYICPTCCHTPPPLSSLINSTLIPSHLTVLHSCHDRHGLRKTIRRILSSVNPISSFLLRPEFSEILCDSPLSTCLLRYLSATSSSSHTPYAALLSDRIVLRPVALEKAWLSLRIRPNVSAIRLMQCHISNSAVITSVIPLANASISAVPLVFRMLHYRNAVRSSLSISSEFVESYPFIRILAQSRLLHEPLYMRLSDLIDVQLTGLRNRHLLPPHLFSELAYTRWSSRQDAKQQYQNPLIARSVNDLKLKLSPLEMWPMNMPERRLMLVMPWMQMGGSEKAMLDIATRAVHMNWGVSFVFTMPFWQEDVLGDISLTHQWMPRAQSVTHDTFDLLALGPLHSSSRLFRYLLESRRPQFVLMANSRWAYYHSAFIRAVLPEAVVADYNHMIHPVWEGGGLPRFGANNSQFFDLHLTASENVATAMRGWIDPQIMKRDSEKVQPCLIGTDPDLLYTGEDWENARRKMRRQFAISDSAVVVLFAGRFVVDKGIDVLAYIVKQTLKDEILAHRMTFLFVGSGTKDDEHILKSLPTSRADGHPLTVVQPPTKGLEELRDYYAMSDIFLLPSVNEGIALVVYEAMAAGLLVITTDVGGQREIVTERTGILLPNHRSVSGMGNHTIASLRKVVSNPAAFKGMVDAGQKLVRQNYTTSKFSSCVMNNLLDAHVRRQDTLGDVVNNFTKESVDENVSALKSVVAKGLAIERYHGLWNRNSVKLAVENLVTIGIKTYICDDSVIAQLQALLRSIRAHYPLVRVLIANDGPTSVVEEKFISEDEYAEEYMLESDSGISYGRNWMVNNTITPYFLLLDDDHVFDDTTNLTVLLDGIRNDEFDIVGMRVRNLPGIDELERTGIVIPRYVALIRKLEDRDLTLCVWNENLGPSIFGITHPIKVDVLHNALVANTDVLQLHGWRNELKVNEHMTFFLDAKDAGLRVGYLPSVFIHHRARDYSDCYFKVRFREDVYRPKLPYKDQFFWDLKCQAKFPARVREHILRYELDV